MVFIATMVAMVAILHCCYALLLLSIDAEWLHVIDVLIRSSRSLMCMTYDMIYDIFSYLEI